MGELVDRDQEHLRLLKIGYYVLAGIGAFTSLFSLIFIGMGLLFASGAVPAQQGSADDPRLLGLIFLGMGVGFLVVCLAGTWLVYYTGRSLAQHRHWTFCMIVAALCCLQVPWGTVIGVCTIIVLNRPEVKALFRPPVPSPAS
jgi:hypothetical protein